MAQDIIKVSVVVATYNQEKYIGHTLESIVTQKTDFAYEVIVGEDCSPDGTAEVVREYAGKYPDKVTAVIREKNLGMTGNMTDIISRAKGEYIAMIEGDDYWTDEKKLQKQVDFLDAHPDYAACFALCTIVDENENRHPEAEEISGFVKKGGEYTIKDFENYLLPGQTASSLYRRSDFVRLPKVLASSGLDLSRFIDRYIVLIIFSFGKIYVFDESMSAYRRIMTKGSGTWSSENDYYSLNNLINYLDGLKEMELIARKTGLELDFDERRIYEFKKLMDNKDEFSKEDTKTIKKKLLDESNNRGRIVASVTKRNIRLLARRVLRKS
ncbi:MAG: glycosyltransferase [Butyrivibrio sp.]|nr:glycosyltransferase [Butyrivibrio sp.]